MAKISPVSIKYMIYAKFSAQGAVERPDVIGALFGQTEGLLGEELEMRELQKEGKIGRIEVNLKTENGKTIGEIEIPSALDQSETSIIAAAIETIERIGPTDAKIEVTKIEDIRESKRDYIVERAKELLKDVKGSADTRGMEMAVSESRKISRLQEYGTEKLPAGNIESDEIIITEGRADVINLLKNGIYNVIGMDGTVLPKTIKELTSEKQATLFVDGDRGGKLIAKNVVENAKIGYIAVAPDGKEVEELTGKEILQALRKKVPANEFFKQRRQTRYKRTRSRKTTEKKTTEKTNLSKQEKEKMKEIMDEITGTKGAVLLDNNLEIIKKVSSSEIINSIKKTKKTVYALIIDGTATPGIIRAVEEEGINHLAAKNFSSVKTNVNLVSL